MEPEYVITSPSPFGAFQQQPQQQSTVPQHHEADDLSAALLETSPKEQPPHHAEPQPEQYRDIWAALVWILVQLGVLITTATSHRTGNSSSSLQFIQIGARSGILLGLVVSALTLTTLLRLAPILVQASLVLAVGGAALGTLWVLLSYGRAWITGGLCGALATLLLWIYARSVWRRVPLAAAYLHMAAAALTASQPAVWVVAYGCVAVVGIYSRLWGWECYYTSSSSSSDTGDGSSSSSTLLLLAVVLAYVWTVTVVRNIVHVTVAGAVGTFVWCPQDGTAAHWSVVMDSLVRASTYSLGSICLGSLLTATVTVAYEGIRWMRRVLVGRRLTAESWLLCVLECLLSFLHRLMEYFHTYAYVYVALYGYDYLTAGQKVAQLFAERGLTVLVNDDLVQRALLLVGGLIGCITGAVGYVWASTVTQDASWLAFGVPFGMGVAVASIVLRVVSSAVDTIVVAYTEDPVAFERNHPGYAARIKAAHRQIYPEEVVDLSPTM